MEEKKFCCCISCDPSLLSPADNTLDSYDEAIKDQLRQCIADACRDGYTFFLTGMGRGAESWFAQLVLERKEKQPEVQLFMVLPVHDYTRDWNEEDQRIHQTLFFSCNGLIFAPAGPETWEGAAYACRELLVHFSQRVVFVHDDFHNSMEMELPEVQDGKTEVLHIPLQSGPKLNV